MHSLALPNDSIPTQPEFAAAATPGRKHSGDPAGLLDIIARKDLHPVFQPIFDFRIQSYIGFEGLIRGPLDSRLRTPDALFSAARESGLAFDLEHACREQTLRAFARQALPGRLFLNVTPDCLFDQRLRNGSTRKLLGELGLSPSRIVLELTENQQITSFPDIQEVLNEYRNQGYQIAIDDLGEGFANLRMWSEVRPEFVKIDRHFIHGIADDTIKFHFVRAMQDIAEISSALIIAEGIEREEDFCCLRDMGIACGQGYFLAMPEATPLKHPSPALFDSLRQKPLTFARHAAGGKAPTAGALLRYIHPVSPETDNEQVIARFDHDPQLDVLPVVHRGEPVGLINRHTIIDRFARPFRRELFGRKKCTLFMDPAPLIVDQHAGVQELGMMLAFAPKHHLLDGFIVTGQGGYLGIGSSHDLMAMITEMQISAARYSNPLTQLPGNVPINEHIDRLLENKKVFFACYFDIDHFKPFNDTYGYRRGDDIIQIVGKLIRELTDSRLDFVGHVGGDDFIVLFQSPDWEERANTIIRQFAACVCGQGHGSIEAGYTAENRQGDPVYYKLPTLSVGALRVQPGDYESHREVSAAAAVAKKQAKKMGGGTLFMERRTPPDSKAFTG